MENSQVVPTPLEEGLAMLESLKNPKVQSAYKLFQRRQRDKTGCYLVEGYRELSRAVEAGEPFEHIFYCPKLFLGENDAKLLASLMVPVYETTEAVFRKLSYRDRPDGWLGVAKQRHRVLEEKVTGDLFVIAEGIEKPGNVGTMLRSADAAGVDGVILSDRTTDLFNPNVVRASVGTLFTQDVYQETNENVLAWVRKRGLTLVATTPHAKKVYTEVPLQGSVAILVGTEQYGLSSFWLEAADIQVQIPMLGVADSLNVATACTLVLYEVLRQRG